MVYYTFCILVIKVFRVTFVLEVYSSLGYNRYNSAFIKI